MTLQQTFRKQGERNTISVDATDVMSGTGIIIMYAGMTTNLAGTINYLLSNKTFYSTPILKSDGMTAGDTYAKDIDVNFDYTINRSLTIEGKAVVNVPFYMIAATNPGFAYVYARLKKDGVEIASNTSHVNETEGTYNMASIFLDIPKTTFKLGSTLTLTVEVWAHGGNSNSVDSNVRLAADPMNRTTGWDATGVCPSKLVFQLPTKITL